MKTVKLGQSALEVTPVCLGTMTFGEQVGEDDAHAILSHSLARGVNFIDTAEMYAVPARAETYVARPRPSSATGLPKPRARVARPCWPPRWRVLRAACPGCVLAVA
jgi:hypothetical protein